GDHTVTAGGAGFQSKDQTFNVPEGGSQSIALTLDKATGATSDLPPPPPHPSRDSPKAMRKTPGFAALGGGVVGVGLGAVTGGIALGKHGSLADACPNGCPSSSQADIDSYHTMGTLSTVGFIVGGVALAAGAVLVITAPKANEKPVAPKTAH